MQLAFSGWRPGMLWDILLCTGQAPPQGIIMPKMTTVLTLSKYYTSRFSQAFAMRFSLVLKSILLIVVFPVPHTVPGLWWALVNMVFYFWGNIFLRKIPIKTFVFMHIVFTCLQQLVYTLSFNVTFVFTLLFVSISTWEWTTHCHF